MSDDKDFENLIKTLQKKIEYDEEITFSKKVIDEYRNPSYFGFIKKPDGTFRLKGPCGDTMRFDLKIKDDKISDVRFWTDGCGATIACGSMLTKIVKGKTIKEIENITDEKLTLKLDGLPEEHLHCSFLAVNTLRRAIENYIINCKKN